MRVKLDELGKKVSSPRVTLEGLGKAEAGILALDVQLDKLTSKTGTAGAAAEGAASSFSLLGPAIAGAIGAGIALSPVLITVGAGLGGLALGAAGTISPLLKAAQATGGLQKNMAKLDPEQQAAAKSLLALQGTYRGFEKALAPTVLADFNSGVRIAGHLLHDLQPVSIATGKALGGVLTGLDKGLQSGEAKQFFTWMAQNAGPDVRLVATDFAGLAKAIPPVMMGLQPLASFLLTTIGKTEQLTGDVARLTSSLATLNHAVPRQGAGDNNPLKWLSDQNLIHGIKYVNDLLPRFLQHAAEGAGLVQKAGQKAQAAGPQMAGFGVKVYTTGQNAGTAGAKLQTMARPCWR